MPRQCPSNIHYTCTIKLGGHTGASGQFGRVTLALRDMEISYSNNLDWHWTGTVVIASESIECDIPEL